LANSGDAGEPAFSVVNKGTGGLIDYTQTDALVGAWCAQFTQATAANQPVCVQLSQGTGGTAFATRMYARYTGLPSAETSIIQLRTPADANLVAVNLSTTGQLIIKNAAGTGFGTSTATLGTGQWWRVEFYGSGLNGSAGNLTVAFFDGHSTTAIEAVNTTTAVTTGTTDRVRIGRMSVADMTTWKHDDFAIALGFPDPIGPSGVVSVEIPPLVSQYAAFF
jgi:hypothetical protein